MYHVRPHRPSPSPSPRAHRTACPLLPPRAPPLPALAGCLPQGYAQEIFPTRVSEAGLISVGFAQLSGKAFADEDF